ncbi:MAG: hypothetical protein ACI90A_000937 [Shewanella sp.]|jgi:hypothetical protein
MSNNDHSTSRRKFLKNTGIGVAGTIVASTFSVAESVAEEAKKISLPDSPHVSKTLLKMAKDIYPHDMIHNKYYQKIVDDLAKQQKVLIGEGVAMLDEQSIAKLGSPFLQISYEPDRVRLLRSIEETTFFIKIRTALMFGLYDNPELFPLFGYQGSSVEKGGYLNRGLNELDWLSE